MSNPITTPLAQNLLRPFNIQQTQENWVQQLNKSVQPVVSVEPLITIDGDFSTFQNLVAVTSGYNQLFANNTGKNVRILAVSYGAPTTALVTAAVNGYLVKCWNGLDPNNSPFTRLSEFYSFAVGDFPLWAFLPLDDQTVLINPVGAVGFMAEVSGGVPSDAMAFTVYYKILP